MSIIRVGLSQNKKFSDGYEAIFGAKKKPAKKSKPVKKGKKKK